MKYVINDQLVLSQVPEGPLAAYLVSFAQSLSQQGYTDHYLHREVILAACFSRWLKHMGVQPYRITFEHSAQYLRSRHRRRRPNRGDNARALGVTLACIKEIARERRGISADTALRLARYFELRRSALKMPQLASTRPDLTAPSQTTSSSRRR